MTEIEYIKATNRVKISLALNILHDVLASKDDEYGITTKELVAIKQLLSKSEEKLFSMIEISEE